ncbi:MAG: DNA repair protein RecO [Coriobacteriia bacterium]|nr:DNA repair protein RecO [Coriobacteriia bacterium]MCL2536900.1 DNA repair protein RecO [Coriobacteriia bacterium]
MAQRSYTTEALVLSKTKLAETDLILTLLSSDDTQIRAVAKGARKPGSKLCGISEPFTALKGKFSVGKNLDILTEASCLDSYAAIRASYEHTMAGSIALELAAQVTNDGDDIARLYAMTRTYLDVLSKAAEEELPILVTAYLLKILAMIGYSPEYELCSRNPRLAQLFRSTFASLGEAEPTPPKQALSDLRTVMNYTEKHVPAKLKTLSYYRKSL